MMESAKIKLYQSDCKDILPLLDKKNIVAVTDPPFNIGYHYASYKDNLPEDAFYDWLGDIFMKNFQKFVIIMYPEMLYKLSFEMGIFPERVLSWVYPSNTRRQHRDIAFFNVSPDFSKVRQPYKNPKDKRVERLIANGSKGSKLYDWFMINQVKNVSKQKTQHPCQMPLEVMNHIVGLLPEELTIVDPFMGSGTTGVACKNLNRNFIGIELDPNYFKIASKRIYKSEKIVQLSLFMEGRN